MLHPTLSAPLARLAALLLLLTTPAATAAADISPQRQEQLVHLLRHDCGSCHGMTLKGGLGPPLTRDILAGKPADLLEDTIYHGLPERAMPPWKGLLSRDEIHWLVQLLQQGELP